MLGVDEETVIEDHQLSNVYIAELLPKVYELMKSYGVDPEVLFPYLTAPRDCIMAVLQYLRENYGTAADYLEEKAGVSKSVQEKLKEQLLF